MAEGDVFTIARALVSANGSVAASKADRVADAFGRGGDGAAEARWRLIAQTVRILLSGAGMPVGDAPVVRAAAQARAKAPRRRRSTAAPRS